MARLQEIKQRITFGCFYTIKPSKELRFTTSLDIKWYGWPFLMWNYAHRERSFKWHEYPRLVWVISKHTVLKWIGYAS